MSKTVRQFLAHLGIGTILIWDLGVTGHRWEFWAVLILLLIASI